VRAAATVPARAIAAPTERPIWEIAPPVWVEFPVALALAVLEAPAWGVGPLG
jgi:hypothetical protein